MTIYLVGVVQFGGYVQPWGLYTDKEKAEKAKEECAKLYGNTWFSSIDGTSDNLQAEDPCVVWEYQTNVGAFGLEKEDTEQD